MNVSEQEIRLEAQKAALRVLQAEARLVESIASDSVALGFLDPRDYGIGDHYGFAGPVSPGVAPAWLDRRKKGEYIPAYIAESQLTWLRRRLRTLAVNNEIAQAITSARQAYAVGTGFTYKIVATCPECPPQIVNDAQKIVDLYVDFNQLASRASEALWRLDTEGEVFFRVFPTPSGLLAVRFVEPDMVRSPLGDSDSAENSFGIRTRKHDVETIEGYWIVQGLPEDKPTPDLIPAEEVLHLKTPDTPSFSKRGLSPFYSIETNLRFAEDLLTSTVSLAKNRAKIAMIRKLKGATAAIAQSLLDNQADQSVTDPTTGQTVNMERYRYGSILTTPDTSDYIFPSSEIAASDHVAVYQMVLRSAGARFNMPEYLISSDASNANYASTLVSEAPFVRTMERLQDHLTQGFGKRRYGTHRSLVWRQLAHSVKLGMLPPAIFSLVDVQVEAPTLVVRDTIKEAQVDQIYHDMKAKSLTTIQMEQGLDPEEQKQNFANEQPTPTQAVPGVLPASNQPATPGQPGVGVGGGRQDIGAGQPQQPPLQA